VIAYYAVDRHIDAITRHGLKPRPCENADVARVYPNVIWLFANRQDELSHAGEAFDRCVNHRSGGCFLLEVEFDPADTSLAHGSNLRHHGHTGGYVYHTDEPVIMVLKPIPPKQIRIIDRTPAWQALGYLLASVPDDDPSPFARLAPHIRELVSLGYDFADSDTLELATSSA